MMVPSPADIARYRHIAAAAVRGVGLLLFLYAGTRVGVFLWANLEELVASFSGGPRQRWNVERLITSVSLQAVLLGFSVFAIGWPRLIARWLVSARVRPACPGCGFDVKGLRSDICPECGLKLGSEFRLDEPSADAKVGATDPE